MNHKTVKILQTILITLFIYTFLYPQSVKVDAGMDQIIKWDKTHSTILNGSTSTDDISVIWTCPVNKDVIFKEPSNPKTEVTFPRPGYYLLKLTAGRNDTVSKTVIINVFKSHSYKYRLTDLIKLMRVDEKISFELPNKLRHN